MTRIIVICAEQDVECVLQTSQKGSHGRYVAQVIVGGEVLGKSEHTFETVAVKEATREAKYRLSQLTPA